MSLLPWPLLQIFVLIGLPLNYEFTKNATFPNLQIGFMKQVVLFDNGINMLTISTPISIHCSNICYLRLIANKFAFSTLITNFKQYIHYNHQLLSMLHVCNLRVLTNLQLGFGLQTFLVKAIFL